MTPRVAGVTSSHVHLCHLFLCHHCTCVHFRWALGSQTKWCLHICHRIGLHRFPTAHSIHKNWSPLRTGGPLKKLTAEVDVGSTEEEQMKENNSQHPCEEFMAEASKSRADMIKMTT